MRPLVKLLIIGAFSVVLLGAAGVVRHYWVGALTEHWQEQLAAASPAEATEMLCRVLRAGGPGMDLAVGALDAAEGRVAEAAHQVIGRELDAAMTRRDIDWQANLASILADRCDRFAHDGRRRAAELALRMLTSLERRTSVDRTELVADCERVLGLTDDEPVVAIQPSPLPSPTAAAVPQQRPASTREAEMAVPSLLAVLPGGGLEPAGPLVPCPTEDAAPSVRSTAPAVAPRDDNPIRALPPRPAPAADGDSAALRPMSLSVPIEPTPNHILAEIDTLVLMGGWRRGETGAEAELRRRGFGPVEFDLAARMLDGNASTRRELAGLLPQMTSVQPTPWLLWLARDDDADVRLTAIATLATSSDPATLDEVERLARDDRDARIRRCGEQIAQRRTGKVKW